MSYLHGKFVWFEHMSSDMAKARAFYGALLGWSSDPVPMGADSYHMIQVAGGGIGGFRTAPPGMGSQWVSYLSVPDVDASYKAVAAAGGKGMMAPMDFGPVGRGAGVLDPLGASFCLWKGAEGDMPDVQDTPVGGFIWNELWTPDVPKALAFYKKTFGFSVDTVNMGHGEYHLLKVGEVRRGGVAAAVEPKAKSLWLPYAKVADCDASAAKAKALGGKVALNPTDIPTIGRFAIVIDPTGAPIAIMKTSGAM